jgi:hypothetical protein
MQRRHGLTSQVALAMSIIRRLLAKMDMADEPIHEADAPFILASIVNACQDR